MGLRQELGDRRRARPLETGHDHRVGVALRPADVVPEDVLHAEVDGLERDVEVVLPHLGVGVVGEAAVGDEHVAARRLQHLVGATRRPRGRCVDRIAERHQPPDHPDALALEGADGLGQVVVGRDGADLEGLRQLGVVADHAGLVLEVELDGVDQAAVDEVHHAGVQLVVRPGRAADVDRPRRVRIDHGHDDVGRGGVARLVDGLELECAGGRRVEVDREVLAVGVERLTRELELSPFFHGAAHGHRIGDRDGVEVRRQVEGGSDAVDDVAPLERGVAEEHPPDRELDRVLALRQRLLDQLLLDQLRGADPHGGAIGLRLEVLEEGDAVDREVGAEQLVLRVERDGDVERGRGPPG